MKERIIEALSSIILLVVAILSGNPLWAIAAGAFAIATNI